MQIRPFTHIQHTITKYSNISFQTKQNTNKTRANDRFKHYSILLTGIAAIAAASAIAINIKRKRANIAISNTKDIFTTNINHAQLSTTEKTANHKIIKVKKKYIKNRIQNHLNKKAEAKKLAEQKDLANKQIIYEDEDLFVTPLRHNNNSKEEINQTEQIKEHEFTKYPFFEKSKTEETIQQHILEKENEAKTLERLKSEMRAILNKDKIDNDYIPYTGKYSTEDSHHIASARVGTKNIEKNDLDFSETSEIERLLSLFNKSDTEPIMENHTYINPFAEPDYLDDIDDLTDFLFG